jgi:phosphoribosyl-AMP cyclohydrolase/phosphoribosyl-ATP pyrophosphohydrolase/phosphoribosyl-AMP cyclohydrolase
MREKRHPLNLESLHYNEAGLIPVIVQDAASGQVLMMAWANRESLRLTHQTGETWFWSRSRRELWHKGATSGNVQKVRRIYIDCDADTVLVQVEAAARPVTPAQSVVFFRELEEE